MQLNEAEKKEHEGYIRSVVIGFSGLFLVLNLIGAYLTKDESRKSAIEWAQENYEEGYEAQISKQIKGVPYIIHFTNWIKITSLIASVLFIKSFSPKHWLSYSLYVALTIAVISALLSANNPGGFEFQDYFYHLNQVLLVVTVPTFIVTLFLYAKNYSEKQILHLRSIHRNNSEN